MAVSITSQTAPYVDKLIVDTDANQTAETNVLSGGATTFIFDVDNSDNTYSVYAKFFNNANPTIGGNSSATAPDIILLCPKQTRQTVTVGDGIYFGTSLSFACTTGADTANQTPPANSVTIRLMAE